MENKQKQTWEYEPIEIRPDEGGKKKKTEENGIKTQENTNAPTNSSEELPSGQPSTTSAGESPIKGDTKIDVSKIDTQTTHIPDGYNSMPLPTIEELGRAYTAVELEKAKKEDAINIVKERKEAGKYTEIENRKKELDNIEAAIRNIKQVGYAEAGEEESLKKRKAELETQIRQEEDSKRDEYYNVIDKQKEFGEAMNLLTEIQMLETRRRLQAQANKLKKPELDWGKGEMKSPFSFTEKGFSELDSEYFGKLKQFETIAKGLGIEGDNVFQIKDNFLNSTETIQSDLEKTLLVLKQEAHEYYTTPERYLKESFYSTVANIIGDVGTYMAISSTDPVILSSGILMKNYGDKITKKYGEYIEPTADILGNFNVGQMMTKDWWMLNGGGLAGSFAVFGALGTATAMTGGAVVGGMGLTGLGAMLGTGLFASTVTTPIMAASYAGTTYNQVIERGGSAEEAAEGAKNTFIAVATSTFLLNTATMGFAYGSNFVTKGITDKLTKGLVGAGTKSSAIITSGLDNLQQEYLRYNFTEKALGLKPEGIVDYFNNPEGQHAFYAGALFGATHVALGSFKGFFTHPALGDVNKVAFEKFTQGEVLSKYAKQGEAGKGELNNILQNNVKQGVISKDQAVEISNTIEKLSNDPQVKDMSGEALNEYSLITQEIEAMGVTEDTTNKTLLGKKKELEAKKDELYYHSKTNPDMVIKRGENAELVVFVNEVETPAESLKGSQKEYYDYISGSGKDMTEALNSAPDKVYELKTENGAKKYTSYEEMVADIEKMPKGTDMVVRIDGDKEGTAKVVEKLKEFGHITEEEYAKYETKKEVKEETPIKAEEVKEELTTPKTELQEEIKSVEETETSEIKSDQAKAKISEGLEELATKLGTIKKVEGEQNPDVVKSIMKIAEGAYDLSMVNAEKLVTKVKDIANEIYADNSDMLKKIIEVINENIENIKKVWYDKNPDYKEKEIKQTDVVKEGMTEVAEIKTSDIENTAQELEKIAKSGTKIEILYKDKFADGKEFSTKLSNTTEYTDFSGEKVKGFKLFGNMATITYNNLAEEYHKAKADGSNPELVKSIEYLLAQKAESKQILQEQKVEEKPIEVKEKDIPTAKMTKAELSPAMETTQTLKNREIVNIIKDTAKRASKSIGTLIKDVKDQVKEAHKQGKLTPAEYESVMTNISKAVKGRDFEGQKQSLIDFVEEKLINAEVRQDKKTAFTVRKKATKLIDNKNMLFGNRTNEVKDALKRVNINDLTPEQVKEYNEAVSEMTTESKRQTPETIDAFLEKINKIEFTPKEKKIKNVAEITEYIDEALKQKVNTIDDFNKLARDTRKSKRLLEQMLREDKITQEEYDTLMEKVSNDYNNVNLEAVVKEEGEKLRKKFIEEGNKLKKEYRDKLRNETDTEIPKAHKNMVDEMTRDLNNEAITDEMTLKDAELYVYVMKNINDGFINGETINLSRRILDIKKYAGTERGLEKISKSKKYQKMINQTKDNYINILNKLRSLNAFRIADYFKQIDNKFYHNTFVEQNKNMVKVKKFEKETLKPVRDAYKKMEGEAKGFKVIGRKKAARENNIKLGIIRLEEEHQSNKQQDLEGKIYEANDPNRPEYLKNYNDTIIEKGLTVGDVSNSQTFRDTIKVWNKIKKDKSNFNPDGTLNIDKMKEKLSKKEKAYLEAVDKLYEELEAYTEAMAMKHGRQFKRVNKYAFQHMVTETSLGEARGNDWLSDVLKGDVNTATKQAGSSHERTLMPKAIEMDLQKVIEKQVSEIAQDVFFREQFLANQRAITRYGKENKGSANFTKALNTTMTERAIREFKGTTKMDAGDKFINKSFGWLSKSKLGNPVRILKEAPANVVRTTISQSLKSGVKAVTGQVDGIYVDMLYDVIADNIGFSSSAEHLNKSKTMGGKGIEYIIIFSDKLVSPAVFEDAFNKSFKKQTGEKFNLKEYKENNFDYVEKNYEAIEMAKTDAIVRLQELYNAKTMLDAATHVQMFGATLDKNKIIGKTLYFLQSFTHNEAKQMVKSTLRVSEGVKTGDSDMIMTGIKDMISIPLTNLAYMQIGLATSRVLASIAKDLTDDDEDVNLSESFNDGLKDYYDTFLNKDKLAITSLASLVSLTAGKYNYAANFLGSYMLSWIMADKTISEETKKGYTEWGKGMYFKPMKLKYTPAYQIGNLHPAASELVNMAEVINDAISTIPNLAEDIKNGDKDAIELSYLINSIVRYIYVNPASNFFDAELRKLKYTKKSSKSDGGTKRYTGRDTGRSVKRDTGR